MQIVPAESGHSRVTGVGRCNIHPILLRVHLTRTEVLGMSIRLPTIPVVAADEDAYLEIGGITAAKSGDGNAHCDFWDGVPLLWPHI